MKSLLIVIVFLLPIMARGQSQRVNLERDVYTLAADSMLGRETDSEGSDMAAKYIESRFVEIGLKPIYDSAFRQKFKFYSGYITGVNLGAIVEGTHPQLKDEYIVVGAHYDHLGVKSSDSTIVFNGADDNASGVAAMLEIARRVKAKPLPRSVIFVAFDAEEKDFEGSKHMVKTDTTYMKNIKVMFSLDMVGGLKYGKKLEYAGVGAINNWRQLFDVENPDNLPVKIKSDKMFPGTDSYSFIKYNIPGIYINTGLKTAYHKPEDDAEKIDYDGLERVVNHFYRVLHNVAQSQELTSTLKHGEYNPVTFGVNLSLGTNRLHRQQGPMTAKTAFAVGLGLNADIPLCRNISAYIGAGWERRYGRTEGGMLHTDALTIPVNIVFKTNQVLNIARLFVQVGGYYNYNFSGRIGDNNIFTKDVSYNRNEYGWSWGAGLQFSRYTLTFISKYSLTDTAPVATLGYQERNYTFLVNLGFRF